MSACYTSIRKDQTRDIIQFKIKVKTANTSIFFLGGGGMKENGLKKYSNKNIKRGIFNFFFGGGGMKENGLQKYSNINRSIFILRFSPCFEN